MSVVHRQKIPEKVRQSQEGGKQGRRDDSRTGKALPDHRVSLRLLRKTIHFAFSFTSRSAELLASPLCILTICTLLFSVSLIFYLNSRCTSSSEYRHGQKINRYIPPILPITRRVTRQYTAPIVPRMMPITKYAFENTIMRIMDISRIAADTIPTILYAISAHRRLTS